MSLLSWPVARSLARQRARSVPVAAVAGLWAAASFAGAALFAANPWQGSGFLLLLFAAALTEGLLSEEVLSGHAQLVLLRPLTRAAWFGGRLAGALLLSGAAVALVSLAALLGGLRLPGGPPPLLLALSLPFAWVDLSAWVSALAAISVVARGLRNIAALALAALAWFALRAAAFQLSAQAPWLGGAMDALAPWLHPHEARSIAFALRDGLRPDWGALAWNLCWIALWWAAGVGLLWRVELARRRA